MPQMPVHTAASSLLLIHLLISGCGDGSGDEGDPVEGEADEGDRPALHGDNRAAVDVASGGVCKSPALLKVVHGRCQSPRSACAGGTPAQLDFAAMSGLLATGIPVAVAPAPGPAVGEGSVPPPLPARANCGEGLICCLDTDECAGLGAQFRSFPYMSIVVPGLRCVEATGAEGEQRFGCPEGQACVVSAVEG